MKKNNNETYIYEGNLLEAARLITETASWIRKKEEAEDSEFKIHLYIISKYKDKLLEDFGQDLLSKEDFCKKEGIKNVSDFRYEAYVTQTIRKSIIKEMNKNIPGPWYTYCLAYDNTNKK